MVDIVDTPKVKEEHKTINEQVEFDVKKKTAGEWIKKRLSWFVVVGSSILYIFKEGMKLSRTGEDILTILAGMALTYLFTLYIAKNLRAMGKQSGKDSKSFKGALKYLLDAKTAIKDIMYLLPSYCTYKNETTLVDVKKLFVEANGLSYKLWQKGYYNKEEIIAKLSPQELEVLASIPEIKITQLAPNDLLSENSKNKLKHLDPLYLGIDERTDEKKATKNMLWSKAIFPIITGYFAVNVILGENLLWGAIQVSIILLIGTTNYMEGEDFVVGELKNRHIKKADLLIEFKNLYENRKDIFAVEEELASELEKEFDTKENKVLQKDTKDKLNFQPT